MKILFITHGDRSKASSRVRAFWIGEELSRLGEHCKYVWPQTRWGVFRLFTRLHNYDVIILQKTYSRWFRLLMRWGKAIGKRCYMDIDDFPSNVGSKKTLKNYEAMLKLSDGVFAGCPALLDYVSAHQKKSWLIPSGIYLPDYAKAIYKLSQIKSEICIGWTGNARTYASDVISILKEPLGILAARHPIRFKLLGACEERELYEAFENIPGLRIDFIDQIAWNDPKAVQEALSDFDIGVFPLLNNHYNQYKCGFKALEYMALGLPLVASPVAVNRSIINHGVDGMLADSSEEWVEALENLIVCADSREKMGKAGRQKIETEYNVSVLAGQVQKILSTDLLHN